LIGKDMNGMALPDSRDDMSSDSGSLTPFILVVSTFVLIGRPQDIIPVIGVIHPGYIIFFVLVFLIIVNRNENNNSSFIKYPEVRYTFGFIVLIYISFIWAGYMKVAYDFLVNFIMIPVYFYCLCRYSQSFGDLKRQLWVLNLIIILYCAMALMKQGVMQRVYVGDMYDPNDLALILVTNLPLAFFLLVSEKGPLKKGILAVALVLSLFTIMLTKSRGGFLGLIMCLAAMLVFKTKINGPRFGIRKILIICMVPFIMVAFGSEAYWSRINTIGGLDKGSGRGGLWMRAIEMIEDKPLLGVGICNFPTSYGTLLNSGQFKHKPSPDDWAPYGWATAHNSFLLVAAELGIPGMLIFIGVLFSCIKSFRRIRRQAMNSGDDQLFFGAGMFLVSFIAFTTCAFFLSFSYQSFFFFLIGLAVIFRSIIEKRTNTES
jgi:O-antigen ligase